MERRVQVQDRQLFPAQQERGRNDHNRHVQRALGDRGDLQDNEVVPFHQTHICKKGKQHKSSFHHMLHSPAPGKAAGETDRKQAEPFRCDRCPSGGHRRGNLYRSVQEHSNEQEYGGHRELNGHGSHQALVHGKRDKISWGKAEILKDFRYFSHKVLQTAGFSNRG